MRKKDELAIDKILECAKKEFIEKGFEGASMRSISEKAGYTTGMIYGRFADKNELFRELVNKPSKQLYDFFVNAQNEFAQYEPNKQYNEMHDYVGDKIDCMLDIVYDNFDIFKLIICKSKGCEYEYYLEKLIAIETENTNRFINDLNKAGISINNVRADLIHMLNTAMFNVMFEIVVHDFTKEEAQLYIRQLEYFFNAGWDKLLGLKKE